MDDKRFILELQSKKRLEHGNIIVVSDEQLNILAFRDLQRDKERDEEILLAFADYKSSEGCSCCRASEAHGEAEERLAKLLNVKQYSDGSGWDFKKARAAIQAAREGKEGSG